MVVSEILLHTYLYFAYSTGRPSKKRWPVVVTFGRVPCAQSWQLHPTCVSTHDIDAAAAGAHAAADAAVDLVAAAGGRDAEDELGFEIEIGKVCLGFVVVWQSDFDDLMNFIF